MTQSFSCRIARRLLAAFGWSLVVEPPSSPKAVIVFYPHTSNWDFFIGITAKSAVALDIHWAGKDSLFSWPLATLSKSFGGIPVKRGQRANQVAQLAAEFGKRESFYLAIAPEGTRRRTDVWKSGFYRLALAARVPVGLAFIDYPRREIGIMGYLTLCGDEASDFANIRKAYAGRIGKYPHQQGPICLHPAPAASNNRNTA